MIHSKSILVVVGLAMALAQAPAIAQAQARLVAQADTVSCEKTVKDYLNTLRFVRQTSGAGIATRIEQTYLNEAEVMQLAGQQGYCSAAQALKNKGAFR